MESEGGINISRLLYACTHATFSQNYEVQRVSSCSFRNSIVLVTFLRLPLLFLSY